MTPPGGRLRFTLFQDATDVLSAFVDLDRAAVEAAAGSRFGAPFDLLPDEAQLAVVSDLGNVDDLDFRFSHCGDTSDLRIVDVEELPDE